MQVRDLFFLTFAGRVLRKKKRENSMELPGGIKEKTQSALTLTAEQEAILQTAGDCRINAVAGSGKTTTVIQYAATRPAGSRILYLAYNRSVKAEATKRFAEQGLHNVRVETAHSLAFRPMVVANGYKVRQQEYKTYEIAELLGPVSSWRKTRRVYPGQSHQQIHGLLLQQCVAKVQDLITAMWCRTEGQSFCSEFLQPD
jgi:hypothetical protein